jgi:NADH-quinone oxidoreductase subunit B
MDLTEPPIAAQTSLPSADSQPTGSMHERGRSRLHSIWPMSFGLACCAIEMMPIGASRLDIARFGAEVFRPSPRQSDLIIIAGRVSNKMAPVIRQLWEQMHEPKWVISMGACATSGGVFNNYALVQSVNQVFPVDAFVSVLPSPAQQLTTPSPCCRKKSSKSAGRCGGRCISPS